MPSYDKEKLMRMMQEQRVGFLASSDLSERLRGLRSQSSRMEQGMRTSAQSVDATDFLEILLELPLEKAVERPLEQVETYHRLVKKAAGDVKAEFSSDINYSTWCEFNQVRLRMQRIESEQNRHNGLMNERFAILPKLKDAVVDWGFNNPDHEM
ncbi:MAG: hypothetical protein RSB86_11180 [Comamonas sp.]|uniref:hypothetical protein n=2 Tax=Comamonas sp. TaxID=34028 RepID=UPI002FCB4F87